jgi:hypothetical protein
VFSLDPLCQGLRGSQKYTCTSVEGLVLRQLGASVPGQRSHQLLRQFVKLADERAPRFQNPCHLAVKFLLISEQI